MKETQSFNDGANNPPSSQEEDDRGENMTNKHVKELLDWSKKNSKLQPAKEPKAA